jgi:hypothetical protein
MSLARRVFHQPCIAGSKAAHRAITESNLQFTGYQDDILPPRCRMPINEGAGRLLGEYNMLCGLRLAQHGMFSEVLLFEMRFAVVSGVHSEDRHGDRLARRHRELSTECSMRAGERAKHGRTNLQHD